ncbi:type II toxin-antitoxin system PemK/MazF family toxin [Hyella patelloides]
MRVIAKSRLGKKRGSLDRKDIAKVNEALNIVLAL